MAERWCLHFLLLIVILQAPIQRVNMSQMSKDEYLRLRSEMVDKEDEMRIGGKMKLSDSERHVNDILMKLKAKELDMASENITDFPPAVHFFRAKALIDKSEVFKMIRNLPKGAVLHVHDASLLDVHWLIKNATYDPHCYMCTDHSSGLSQFHFFDKPPSVSSTGCEWIQVIKVRAQAQDPAKFDEMVYKQLTLIVDDPVEVYPTADAVWSRFEDLFSSTFGLLLYAPVFRAYFYEALQQFYDDGVQYMELRSLFLPVYELDGRVHDSQWVLEAYVNTTLQFVHDHPDFSGAKFIYTASRSANRSSVAAAVGETMKLRAQFPSYLAGFDLVDREDTGNPYLYYIDQLLYPSQTGVDLPYFFHAGETDWEDGIDMNLLDAVLLNVSRIGHGYAITKHPLVRQLLETRRIPLEICPISNQQVNGDVMIKVMKLVDDIRNHPAADLMASDFPLVISSDDPALWGAVGLSYDFYEAFMGLGGAAADLATLKQLAVNSIQYSIMSVAEKTAAFTLWQKKWNNFIEQYR